jgi:nicotinamide mononucleotide transporter
MRLLKNWNTFELAWLGLFMAVAIVLTIIWQDTVFGLLVFITGVFCVVLTAKGSIWSYAFGLFNTLGYAYLAYTNNLFGEVGLNLLFFLPMNFVGFFLWKKNMQSKTNVRMKKMTAKSLIITVVTCVISIAVVGFLLSLIKTQNTPYLDATTNVLSVIATILTARRFREQWLLYIVLNVFTIIMWSIRTVNGSPDGVLMIVMWSAYLVNAFYGYYNWTKGAKQVEKLEV